MIAFMLFLVVLTGIGAVSGWRSAAVIGATLAALALLVMVLGS